MRPAMVALKAQHSRPINRINNAMKLSDREFAGMVLMAMADYQKKYFAPIGFYDDDADVIDDIQERAHVAGWDCAGNKLTNRIKRVCNKLVNGGVLLRGMYGTRKEYVGEPAKQMEYSFKNPSYMWRLNPESNVNYSSMMPPASELNALLNRCFDD